MNELQSKEESNIRIARSKSKPIFATSPLLGHLVSAGFEMKMSARRAHEHKSRCIDHATKVNKFNWSFTELQT
jgi:hypothetical protein